jgi:hypothetical protein
VDKQPKIPKKVNMKWQTLSVIVPLTFIFACHEIKKTRKGLLIYFPLEIGLSIISGYLAGLFDWPPYSGLAVFIIDYVPYIITGIYFIRKWSIEWNKKIDEQNRIN